MIVLSFNLVVKANSIVRVDMNIFVDKQGNANVSEKWYTILSEGTEGYRTFTKLDNSNITDFTVTDNTGKTYDLIENWNVSDSFQQKAYKNGYHRIKDGIELCWGISEYGEKQYTLNYKISNFVKNYKDNVQGIYFNFFNLDQDVGYVSIKINSDIPFNLDTSRIILVQ